MIRGLVTSLIAAHSASGLAVTPVAKVISLLEKLQSQVEADGQAEATAYDKYACFCKEQSKKKLYLIETADSKIADLKADIEFFNGEIKKLEKEIKDLNTEVGTQEGRIKKLTDTRAANFRAFQKAQADKKAAISAVERAIAAIKASTKQMKDTHISLAAKEMAQSLGLMDLDLSNHDTRVLQSFLAMSEPGKPHAYKFHGKTILNLLKGLKTKFDTELVKLETREREDKEKSNTLKQTATNALQAAQDALERAEAAEAKNSESKENAEGQKSTTEGERRDNQAFLDDLTSQCESKASDWDARSSKRADELKALNDAMEELKKEGGVKQNWSANKKLNLLGKSRKQSVEKHFDEEDNDAGDDALLQSGDDEDVSFLQTTGHVHQALKFLASQARLLKSPALATLMVKVSADADPFKRVRTLIDDMIKRLKDEASSEKETMEDCKKKMSEANTELDKQSIEIERLSKNMADLNATIRSEKETIKEKTQLIADTQNAKKEAAQLRLSEKNENERVILHSGEGLAAVQNAIRILKGFYKESLLQEEPYVTRENTHLKGSDAAGNTVEDLAPETYEAGYEGRTAESKGIIGLLEVIENDFDNTGKKTTSDEAAAVTEFEKQEKEFNKTISDAEEAVKKAEASKSKAEADLDTADEDHKVATKTKKAQVALLESYRSTCVEGEVDAKERFARREQEIAALKDALNILRGVDVDLP